ncbi:hypothetical protein AVEN_12565-1 [Araneus ventricosus]|uniref:Mos1 transposase HTH domain-containing protein n=1 Tax=Araneus ventricosus TaxID=182803 RepID=A0A4Y2AC36_ARAVE|nr:hypothetical protein AVEN_12565-1 [Araneus ventricosus]
MSSYGRIVGSPQVKFAVELSISKGTVHHITYKKLGYGKVCAQWVPTHLSENQKTARRELDTQQPRSFYNEAIHSLPTRWGSVYQCQWRLFIVVLFHINCN